jgi:glycosyltransferase involved in cell wall biosynthesis
VRHPRTTVCEGSLARDRATFEPVRVLIVHNRYRSSLPSGENRVVDDEIELLRNAGADVTTLIRSSDDLVSATTMRRLPYALGPVHGFDAVRELRHRIAENRPDVVHVHNLFPMISPSVIRVAHRAGIPVVQTVHNYRHSCVRGTLFRNGSICEDCVGRIPWPGVMHGCYRDSRIESAAMATGLLAHRATWRLVDRFLPVSSFVGERLRAFGIPADRIVVKANAVADPGPQPRPGDTILFAGRLDPEKGIELLIDAWRRRRPDGYRLVIAGDGALRPVVDAVAAEMSSVEALGAVDRATMTKLLRASGAVVVPSIWYEGAPRIITEAWSYSRPVLATSIGALASMVDASTGWTAEPTLDAFAYTLSTITREATRERGAAARRLYLRTSTPRAVSDALLSTYDELLRRS